MNENTLYHQIKQGDAEAMKSLFHLHYKPLCTYVVQFTKSMPEAEDIVQGIFVRLWSNRETLTIVTSTKAYLYRSAHNAYIDTYRKSKKEILLLDRLKYEALSNQLEEDDTLLQQRLAKTKLLISVLPERCKEVLLLSKKEGYKNREIAKKLEISIKTVEAHLAVAIKKIQDSFKDD